MVIYSLMFRDDLDCLNGEVISRNVQQAALGTQQVSSNIVDVQQGASETGSASS